MLDPDAGEMTMRRPTFALVLSISILVSTNASLAVTGCMQTVESLVSKAQIVVFGEVLSLETAPRACRSDGPLIPNCRILISITLKAESYLAGDGPQQLTIRIPHRLPSLDCDDPYTLEQGSHVAMFLISSGDGYTSLEDESSVFPLNRLDQFTEERIRVALKLAKVSLTLRIPDKDTEPGRRVTVIHTLHNEGSSPVNPCIANPHWFLQGFGKHYAYNGWQDDYKEPECFGEVMPGESATWVHTVVLMDVGPGEASLRASLEIFDRSRCGTTPCGTSVLRSEPLQFELRPMSRENH